MQSGPAWIFRIWAGKSPVSPLRIRGEILIKPARIAYYLAAQGSPIHRDGSQWAENSAAVSK